MNYRYLTTTSALFALTICGAAAAPQFAGGARRTDPKVGELIQQSIAAHGGDALTRLRTYQETSEMRGSGPLGLRTPTQQCEIWFDRKAECGRWRMSKDNKTLGVYQQTPDGVFLETKEAAPQRVRGAETPFAFTPLLKTGVLGLLALRNTDDTISFLPNGEIKGKKGRLLVRVQNAPQETLLLDRSGLSRASCQTTWSYLFAPDGTLIAERITQTQPKRVVDTQLSYDRFQTIEGIKVPTEISVKSSLAPRGFSIKFTVKQVAINAAVDPATFRTP